MRNLKIIVILCAITFISSGCSTAKYHVVKDDGKDGVNVQSVEASAPVGDAAVMVIYFGPEKTPLIKAGVDSTALVNATAAAGRQAVDIALKLAR